MQSQYYTVQPAAYYVVHAPQNVTYSHAVYEQPQAQTLTVTLPTDACYGRLYQVQAEDGRMVSFQVPWGSGPGMQVQVTY